MSATTERVTTQEEVDRFARDGFIVIDNLIPLDELREFAEHVTASVARRTAHDTRAVHEKSLYQQSFQQCVNLWENDPDVAPLTFHPRVGQAAAELLRTPAIRIWHDQALYKEAGGRITDPHQDQPYWPLLEPTTVTAWIPFDGSTVANGAMFYVPGSHRAGLRKFVDIFRLFGEPDDVMTDPSIEGIEPVTMEVPAGSVAFHHGLTVHGAHPNTSDQTRRVHTMIFFADGCTRSSRQPHEIVDRPGIEVGAVIASDISPIVWPRPADQPIPPPPAVPRPAI